ASPSIGSDYNPEFIAGVTRINDEFIMILNIGKVFSTEDFDYLTEASTSDGASKINNG
ncbi:MAG: hypothetical protein JKY54_12480, partial [Flavobacteriales bacterium]|nr:hypothetical protein [Flavobacteriales bacterium]